MTTTTHHRLSSKAMTVANFLRKQGWTLSEALKKGWQVAKCWWAMRKGAVLVSFQKKDGTVTERRATLNDGLYTYEVQGGNKANPLQVCFYDLTKSAFRSFCAGNLVSYSIA
jgi:WYL_2, Sm-like SH3 beta-barrel fold